jgi:hypothetical protein
MESEKKPDAPPETSDVERDARQRVDAVVLRIARLIGRQMARETFDHLTAVNDNQDGDMP